MITRKLVCSAAATGLAWACLAAGPAAAATKTGMDKNGDYCFRYGSGLDGGISNAFVLDVDRADHMHKQRTWRVVGYGQGSRVTDTVETWVANVTGSATLLGKPNNGLPGGAVIQMALTGTSFGIHDDPAVTGMWEVDYNLQLNPKTLKGTIVGKSVFTPLAGTTAGVPVTVVVNEPINPVSCKKL